MSGSGPSKRFSRSILTEKLVPLFLGLLILALLAILVVLALALLGLIPSAASM